MDLDILDECLYIYKSYICDKKNTTMTLIWSWSTSYAGYGLMKKNFLFILNKCKNDRLLECFDNIVDNVQLAFIVFRIQD